MLKRERRQGWSGRYKKGKFLRIKNEPAKKKDFGNVQEWGIVYNTWMDWLIEFYIDKKGKEPVKDFIQAQDDGTVAEILHVIGLLREFHINLGMPYVKKIDKSGLRELRIKHGSNIYRIFFFAHTGRKIVLLHAILKKQDKIPESDKSLAIKRMNEYKSKP